MGEVGHLVVTGANGFIGRRLVSLALQQGWSVTALARSTEWLRSLTSDQLRVADWNIDNATRYLELLEGADVVCHLAAFVPSDYGDPSHAAECLQTNALGTLQLLQVSLQAGVGRFIYFSSGQAYYPRGRLAAEGDPLYTTGRATFYLASKIVGEMYTEHFRVAQNFPTIVLRLASVYGAHMNARSLVPIFVTRAVSGLPLEVMDGGRHTIDLVYVDDVARAALNAARCPETGVFNIGSGQAYSTLEIAREILDALGQPHDLIDLKAPNTGTRFKGFSGLAINRAIDHLGFEPTTFAEGIKRYCVEVAQDPALATAIIANNKQS